MIDSENYDEVKSALQEIIDQLKCLKNIAIIDKNGTTCNLQIEQYLCCDFKMLTILYGLNNSNSHYGCIFCEHDLSSDKITNKQTGQVVCKNYEILPINRSIARANEIVSNEFSEPFNHRGYLRNPIINIDFPFCTFDTLHFVLRCAERMLSILFDYIRDLESITCSQDLSRRPIMKKFLNFLTDTCNIGNAYYFKLKDVEEGTETIKLRSFNSNELEKIFEKVYSISEDNFGSTNLLSIFQADDSFKGLPNNDAYKQLQIINNMWYTFYKIYQVLKNKR